MEDAFARYYQVGKMMAYAYIKAGPAEGNKTMAAFDEAAEEINITTNGTEFKDF